MNIASLITFYLLVPLLVWAGRTEKLDVHRSTVHYTRSDFIELYNFTKNNCTFSVNWMQPTSGSVLVEASHGGKHVHQYSIYLPTCIPDPLYPKGTVEKCVRNRKLGQYFDFQTKEIYTDQFFIVKYLQKSLSANETWWCDVYKTEDYNFTQVDKCVYVQNGMEAMLDPLYNSVNSESQEKLMFGTGTWAKCAGRNQTTICTDQFTGIKINKELWCKKSNPAAGPQGYKIVLYYDKIELGSYTLSNSENLGSDNDTTKACKLFNFAKTKNGLVLAVQFMNKPNEKENNWEYKCHSYRRTTSKQGGGITYDNIQGESECNDYEDLKSY